MFKDRWSVKTRSKETATVVWLYGCASKVAYPKPLSYRSLQQRSTDTGINRETRGRGVAVL